MSYEQRAFHFLPNSTFSRFSELNPCHGMLITKQCHFSPIKTAVLVCAQESKFRKYYGIKKINSQIFFHIGVQKVRLDEKIPLQ